MASILSEIMKYPNVHFTLPPASLFKFPPSPLPRTLAPPVADWSLARPFNIDPTLYNDLLNIRVPVTIAVTYATAVFLLNRFNKRHGNRPWAISQTRIFFCFVLLHNILLAIYSGWTFVGMINAVRNTWPGWHTGNGAAGPVDALCKMSGPRGFGSAATYNITSDHWGVTDQAIKLLGGFPDSTDVGRLWNEGLGFYGWIFYLSKFYEVLDTLIIIAKGKRSSFLQTYHHAGAMLCMWAGIRYMSPPIWMFVCINSGIHALMYTYYTLTACSVRVPVAMKRALTTLQITQFVVGVAYALGHLFVSYDLPVQTPYLFTHNLSKAIPSVTSAIASATASAGLGNWLKKLALRAAGEEGLAANVKNAQGEAFGIDAVKSLESEQVRQEIRYRWTTTTVNCIDTSGQNFAILLNILYLAPLTALFVRFFVRSYLKRTSKSARHPTQQRAISRSSFDALKGVEREVFRAMAADGGSIPTSEDETAVEVSQELQKDIDSVRAGFRKIPNSAHSSALNSPMKAGDAKRYSNMEADAEKIMKKALAEATKKTEEWKDEADSDIDSRPKSKGTGMDESWVKDEATYKSKGRKGDSTTDPKAYEANIDGMMNKKEKEAEKEMQP